jgi:predicted HAD superfamily phosphohydrolase YqeG
MNIYDEQRLTRAIQKYGEGAKYVQMIRDQIASDARGQSAREMYITGMVKKAPGGKEPERAK